MLLRRLTPFACCLFVCLLGCQPAKDVPLSESGSTRPAEADHDHEHGHAHADGQDHGHDHADGDPTHEDMPNVDSPAGGDDKATTAEVEKTLKADNTGAAAKSDESKPADVKPADPAKEKQNETAIEQQQSLADEVVLGEDQTLYEGIPGEGSLSVEQIKTWLARPDVHEELKVELPLGLSLAQGQIIGLDENPLTRAKIELGRQLYFDGRLSSDGSISCASCHHPDTGWAAHTQFGVGVGGQTGNRNSPVSYNRIVSGPQFWDGRAASLEEQAVGPIANPVEMSNTHEVAVKTVNGIEGYQVQFDAIFGKDSCNIDNIAKAIAAFERAVVTGPSPYDYYAMLKPYTDQFSQEELASLKEDDPETYASYEAAKKASDAHPMSESARRGLALFFDNQKTGCTQCHVGANFTDEKYHNIGVGMDTEKPDLGRFEVTKDEKDKGAFKTPTLRNVEETAPYMHDGSQKTLEEVVEWYAKGGHPNPWLSEKIKKLDLTDQDKQDLIAFMKSLTGPFPKVEPGRLPES